MSDLASLSSLAVQVLGKTTEGLTALRERAQRTKDIEIKEQISALFDNVLQLKDVVSRLLDQTKELQNKISQQQNPPLKPKIMPVGQTNYYYLGDEGPYCQPCYDKTKTLISLLPRKMESLGGAHRDCPVCHSNFYETPNRVPHVEPFDGDDFC
jgi:hypothetical protein